MERTLNKKHILFQSYPLVQSYGGKTPYVEAEKMHVFTFKFTCFEHDFIFIFFYLPIQHNLNLPNHLF